MDDALLDKRQERRIRSIIQQSITPLIVLAVFCAMWSYTGGDSGDVGVEQQRLTLHETATGGMVERLGIGDAVENVDNQVEEEWMLIDSEGADKFLDINPGLLEEGDKEESRKDAIPILLEGGDKEESREGAICMLVRGWLSTMRYEFGVQEEIKVSTPISLPLTQLECKRRSKFPHPLPHL
jgi:hypothetical protein